MVIFCTKSGQESNIYDELSEDFQTSSINENDL